MRKIITPLMMTTVVLLGFISAAHAVDPALTYHGRLLNSSSVPVTSSAVQFKIQIRSPGTENCLLYEETQTKDLSATSGVFVLGINDGSGTRTDTTAIPFTSVFNNNLAFTGLPTGDCTTGTSYTPASVDGRALALYFNDGTFTGWEAAPTQAVNYSALAVSALQVGGFSSSSLVRVANTSGPQTATALTPANFQELLNLINGVSTQYMQSSSTAGTALPGLTTPPTSPAAGQIWYDASNNVIKYYNGTSVQTISAAGTGIASLTVGTSLTAGGVSGGTLTSSGTIDLASTGVTAGTYPKVTVDSYGRVTAGAALAQTDLPVISTAGQVSGSAITSGTIGGSTIINTSGTVTAASISATSGVLRSLTLTNASSQSIVISPPTTITGTPHLTLPAAVASAAGQVLTSDTSGNLSWTTPSTAASSYSGTLPVANGGTNSSTALTGNKIMLSNGTAIVEGSALSNGQLLIGSTGTAPVAASLTAGTGITVTNSAGAITIGTTGLMSNSLADGKIWVGQSGTPTAVTPSGDITTTNAGVFTVTQVQGIPVDTINPTTSGQTLRYNGSEWYPDFISMADLRSTVTGTTALTSCSASQTLTWSSAADNLACSNIAISSSQVTYGSQTANTVLAAPSGSAGAPVFRALTTADIPGLSWSQITTGTPTTLAGYGITNALQNLGGSPGIETGADASKPTSPTAGTIYFATDTKTIYQYNSSAWVAIATSSGSGGTITALTGDVSASGSGSVAATVNSVGGSTAADVHTAEVAANAATNSNTASSLVKRDASGNFTAGTITANLTGAASSNVLKTGDSMSGNLIFATGKGTQYTDSSTNTVTLEAPTSITTSYVLKLPAAVASSAGQVLSSDTSGNLSWATVSTTATSYSGILPVANGGTNSSTALANNQIMVSSSGKIVEAGTMSNGQLLIGSTGAAPVLAAITAGTGISVTNSAGGITIASTGPTSLASGDIWVGNASSGAMPVAPSGDVTMTNAGVFTVAKIQGTSVSATSPTSSGQTLRYNGSSWTPNFISMADLRSTITGAQALTSCSANQTLTWSSATDNLACSSIAISDSQITYGSEAANTFLAAPNGSSGTPTYRTMVSADLPAGTLSGSGTANYVPYYSTSTALANSPMYVSGSSVGIGTTSPSEPLQVIGNSRFGYVGSEDATWNNGSIYYYNDSSYAGLEIQNRGTWGGSGSWVRMWDDNGNTGNVMSLSMGNSTNTGTGLFGLAHNTYSSLSTSLGSAASGNGRILALGTGNNNSLVLGSDNVERLRITAAGNIGIGTTSPVTYLQVAKAPTASANYPVLAVGSGAFDGATTGYFIGNASGTAIGSNLASGYGGDLMNLEIAGVSKFKVDASGDITYSGTLNGSGNTTTTGNYSTSGNIATTGTGTITSAGTITSGGAIIDSATTASTSSTTGALIVSGGAGIAGALNVGSTLATTGSITSGADFLAAYGTPAAPSYAYSSDTTTGVFAPSAGSLAFSTAGLQRMVLSSSGTVGIGISTPAATFDLSDSNTSDTAGSSQKMRFTYQTTPLFGYRMSSSNRYLILDRYWTSWNATSSIDREYGYFGLGTTTPLSALDVNGGVAVGSYAGTNAAPSNSMIISGGVGIGTTSPLSKLDVNGGVAIGSYAGTNAAPSNSLIVSGNIGIGTSAPAGMLDINKSISQTVSSTVGPYLSLSTSTLTDSGTAASGTATGAVFNSMASPTLAATNTSVTTTRANTLYIAGAPKAGTNEVLSNTSALYIDAAAIAPTGTATVSNGLVVNSQTGATSNYIATFLSSGSPYVGIGTTAPAYDLHVYNAHGGGNLGIDGNGTQTIALLRNGTVYSSWNSPNANPGNITFSAPSGSLNIQTLSTSPLMLNPSGGKVGVGLASPSYELDVAGDINLASANALRVGGTSICTSAGCTATSDRRYKENIKPLEDSLEKVLKLQAVQYDWIDKKKFGDKHQIGLIAQDVEKVFPEVVVSDKETGMKSVYYDHLIAPVIESIKDMNKHFSDLVKSFDGQSRLLASVKADAQEKDKRINKLEVENAALKARLDKIEKTLESKTKL